MKAYSALGRFRPASRCAPGCWRSSPTRPATAGARRPARGAGAARRRRGAPLAGRRPPLRRRRSSRASAARCCWPGSARLSERDRTVIACRYLLELSRGRDGGGARRAAPGTVKSRLSRALDRLREEVGERCVERELRELRDRVAGDAGRRRRGRRRGWRRAPRRAAPWLRPARLAARRRRRRRCVIAVVMAVPPAARRGARLLGCRQRADRARASRSRRAFGSGLVLGEPVTLEQARRRRLPRARAARRSATRRRLYARRRPGRASTSSTARGRADRARARPARACSSPSCARPSRR